MQSYFVNKNEAGQRFDKLLIKRLNKAPKSFIYKMLRKKNITLNGKKATGSEMLEQGDKIKMFLSDETIEKFTEEVDTVKVKQEFQVVFEDKHILIVNKPVGLLSQKAEADDISLNEQIISYLIESKQIKKQDLQTFKPSICNRLDRNTSGLVIAGKTLISLQTISELFRNHQLDKYYVCIVAGNLKRNARVSGFLTKNESNNTVSIIPDKTTDSEEFEMEYEPISNKNDFTLLKVKLITGKTHQIRVHLASIGHPVIGDYKYGIRKINDNFKRNYGLKYQLLHSWQLSLPQIEGELEYLSGKTFQAKVPELFAKIQKELHL